MIKKTKVLLFFSLILTSCTQPLSDAIKVNIDVSKVTGEIRPLNGGNLGPVCHRMILDMTEEFMELNIPVIRTHDVPWFSMPAVDVHTIFGNFDLDPSDPENYDFRQTDDYIASLVGTGAEIVYRLGESIEHSENKYNVNPPSDNEKWAEICSNIIRHYNQGWADGFEHNIKYWEIWNEPDIRPACWTGTDEQFFDLYNTVSKKIKKEFPGIKVGGPAIAQPVHQENDRWIPTDFTRNFLENCRDHAVPLDFFSWHMYGDDPFESGQRPGHVRKMLDEFGFTNTESHMNEWNYIPDNNWNNLMTEQGMVREAAYKKQSGVWGAAFTATVLMLLQDQPIDVANFYTTTAGLFGIFSGFGEPHKVYYAMKAFAQLIKTPERISVDYNIDDGLVFCAGRSEDQSEINVLVSNYTEETRNILLTFKNHEIKPSTKYQVYAIDKLHSHTRKRDARVHGKNEFYINAIMKGPSVILVKITSEQ
jgi:hypothetical protein